MDAPLHESQLTACGIRTRVLQGGVNLRATDAVARFGGEEFVLLLPDTNVDSGVAAMTRLQRELTTRFFLQGSEKILITFSAGVAQLHDSETSVDALKRADQSMYLAKRSGKNRVMAA